MTIPPLVLIAVSVIGFGWSLTLHPLSLKGFQQKSRLVTFFIFALIAGAVWLMLAVSHYGRWQ